MAHRTAGQFDSPNNKLISRLYAEQCAAEPIHLLGGVQPHGYLTVIDLTDGCICQLSSGIVNHYPGISDPGSLLGQPAQDWFKPLKGSLGDLLKELKVEARTELRLCRRTPACITDKIQWDGGNEVECSGYRHEHYAVLEWVPIQYDFDRALDDMHVLSNLSQALAEPTSTETIEHFLGESAERLQQLARYHRVMIYRFLPDWSGEVMAEATSEGVAQRFIGLRFPSSDIPPQARALYLRNRLRVLADVEAGPDVLVPERLPCGQILDQSIGLLRSMSEAHLTYLRNMQVRATLTISIIVDGRLWGMIACHHDAALVPPNHVLKSMRTSAELLSRFISTRVKDLTRTETSIRLERFRQTVGRFCQQLSNEEPVKDMLRQYAPELCDPMHAAYVGLHTSGRLVTSFKLGSEEEQALGKDLQALAATVPPGQILAWDSLPDLLQESPGLPTNAAGLMIAVLPAEPGDFLFWVRSRLVSEVNWAGEPGKFVVADSEGGIKLEPRRSFSVWKETTGARCEPWVQDDEELAKMAARRVSECFSGLMARRLRRSLDWASSHDPLTNLLNRNALNVELREAIKDGAVAVLLIDLDDFKQVNDTLGHQVGDAVLLEVASRLSATMRQNDVVGRLGGDEFIILCRVSSVASATAEIARVVARLYAVFARPVTYGSKEFQIGLSIGISCAPEDGDQPDMLLKRADIALYEAKKTGRGRSILYQPQMEDRVRRKVDTERQLAKAIKKGQLVLYYQPQIDLVARRVVGCEALVRWQHPTQGLLMPGFFLPIAEEGRLIHDIGRWVIDEATMQLAQWNQSIDPGFSIAINVSFAQVRDGEVVNEIRQALERSCINPSNLHIELTESSILGDEDRCSAVTQELQALGLSVVLDDFGTGFSSLSHIHRLQLDCIKIDRSFVMQLERDQQAQAVVQSLLSLAGNLHLAVVAEGVEREIQASWLLDAGCRMAQGYLWSPAVSAETFVEVMRKINTGLRQ